MPDNGAFAGGAYPAPAVRGEGKDNGTTGIRTHGQDGATDGVRQPKVPLRSNCLCRLLTQPHRASLLPHCSGLLVVGAGAKAGTRKQARSARPGLSRQRASVLMEMHASQEERERARAQQKNDYEGSTRGGLPHGYGTKIYTIEKSWQGLCLCTRRKACRTLSAPAYRRRRGRALAWTSLGFTRRFCACIDADTIARAHMRHDWIPACVLTHAMHLCLGFALGNTGRLWPFGQIFQTGAISGQVSTILAVPGQDSSVRALSYARVASGGRPFPALSRVHTCDLRQMLSKKLLSTWFSSSDPITSYHGLHNRTVTPRPGCS